MSEMPEEETDMEEQGLPLFLVAKFKPPFLICENGVIKTKEDEK